MKWLAFMLNVIVLLQSFMPCADSGIISDRSILVLGRADNHQKESDHTDDCAPFCHCTCCAGFSVNHTIANVQTTPFRYNRSLFSIYSFNLLSISLPVWQPPQLA